MYVRRAGREDAGLERPDRGRSDELAVGFAVAGGVGLAVPLGLAAEELFGGDEALIVRAGHEVGGEGLEVE